MRVTQWFQSLATDFYDTGIQKFVPQYDLSIPEVNIFKNSQHLLYLFQ